MCYCRYCATNTAPKFREIVNEVLQNVKKMEDSLAKLQKIRKKPSAQANQPTKSSDDDKIRLQLKLDLSYFLQKYTSDYLVDAQGGELKSIAAIVCNIEQKLNENKVNGDI